MQLPASQALRKSIAASKVFKALAEAMEYTPCITKQEKKSKKADKTKGNTAPKKKKTNPKKKECQATKEEKSVPLDAAQPAEEAVQEGTKYEPGEYIKCCKSFIKEFLAQAAANGEEASYAMARDKWATSMKRASLLSTVSLPELKRRRFVSKDCTTNPFAAMVAQVQE